MKIRKRFNNSGAEKITHIVVLLITFIGVTSLLLGIITPLIILADKGSYSELRDYEIIGGEPYSFWMPEYDITSANVTNEAWVDIDTDLCFYYDLEEGYEDYDNRTPFFVVRNNINYDPDWLLTHPFYSTIVYRHIYNDFIYIFQSYGWYSKRAIAFSYDDIIFNQITTSNYSVNNFAFGDLGFTLFVTTPGIADDFSADLWDNNFKLKLGISHFPKYEEISIWSSIGQILTLSLPGLIYPLNLLIGIVFWATIGIVALTLISRFIPFISGG